MFVSNSKNIKLNTYINLMNEWDYMKNEEIGLFPDKLTHGSNKKAWWICKKGHSFDQRISNRTIKQYECPYCSNQRLLSGYNDFSTRNPELLSEWDYEKNIGISPSMVMSGSARKVYWKCSYGHSYLATLNHRTSLESTGCPICYSGRQTSFAEKAVYYYIKKEFPDAISGMKNVFGSRFEFDVFIPSLMTAIEYDGEAWHTKEKIEIDQRKYKLCQKNNVRLIRLREKAYELGSDVADIEFTHDNMYKPKVLSQIIYDLIKYLTFKSDFDMQIDIDIERDRIKILGSMKNIKDNSIDVLYPHLIEEWHPTLNEDLSPKMFTPGSDHKIWWICCTCNYEYKATISHRVSGTGCPKCGIYKSLKAKSRPVAMIDINTGEEVEIFESISSASRKMGISAGNICMVLKGERKHTKGYTWKYI